MPPADLVSRRRQLALVSASAVGVVAVVAVVALVGHPWRGTAAGGPAAPVSVAAMSSGSPFANAATSTTAISVSEPASSAALASPPAAMSQPPPPSTTPPAARRASPTAHSVPQDSQPNLKVSVQLSPTQVVWGHPVRVTVTVVNAGGVFDRPLLLFVQGSDPSDTVSDAMAPCTANGAIRCPITDVRPGHKWSFTFTLIPGPFPGTDGFDDPVGGAIDYTDVHGQQQQTPSFSGDLLLFDPPQSSPPLAPGAPSDTPSPVPSASTPSSSPTAVPSAG